jgi:hypothetical protein
MFSRGEMRSSEGAKAAVESQQRAAKLEPQVEQRLNFQGKVLARSLNKKTQNQVQQKTRRAEAAERAVERAKKSEARVFESWANESELKNGRWSGHKTARASSKRHL